MLLIVYSTEILRLAGGTFVQKTGRRAAAYAACYRARVAVTCAPARAG